MKIHCLAAIGVTTMIQVLVAGSNLASGTSQGAPKLPSLRSRAAGNNGVGIDMMFLEYPQSRVPKLLEIADVIVYGRIRSIEARLSVDETVVNTDYVIEPITVFKERVAVTTARTPGPTSQLLVRRPGGEIMDQGMHLITYAHPYPEKEPFVTRG